MVKQILPAFCFIVLLSSCSSIKPLQFSNNQKVESETQARKPAKFLDNINLSPKSSGPDQVLTSAQSKVASTFHKPATTIKNQESNQLADILARRNAANAVEVASKVQLKYAVLLNTEVEALPNIELLESVDQWYGVRYRTGGNTKSGVDCSGFSVAIYAAVYGIMLPRVSRDQYKLTKKISTTELREGDLVFFDTRGGGQVSHVGVYLGNNKFVHASVSKGVMVNDLFQSYYLKRYIGAGRIENKSLATNASPLP